VFDSGDGSVSFESVLSTTNDSVPPQTKKEEKRQYILQIFDSLAPKDTEADRRGYPTTLFKHCEADDEVFVPSKVSEKYNLCENAVSRMFRSNSTYMKQICEIYYRASIVWEPPMGKFSDGPLVELIATFAVKRTNGVETDEMNKGEFMSSSTAAMHGLITALDEVLAV
jgi:hypothetical protein